jgi:tRNA(fMet)-specific endonuclease VapC
MKYLLDANTCILYLNGRSVGITSKLQSLLPEDIAVCSVVKAELFYGAMKSANQQDSLKKQQEFFEPYLSFPFDDKSALEYGKIRADLAQKGTPIGPNDLMIAAIAIVNNLILVTNNSKEFGRVIGLKLEDWHNNP